MAAKLLLLLVTACAAELGFQPKQQYMYAYEAKQGTGIPGLDTQWSAMGIKMNVFIQVPTTDNLSVQLKDIKFGEAQNLKVHRQWRQEISMRWQNDEQFTRLLSQPFQVVLRQGVVRQIITEQNEPTWMVNIKKSIAQMFQIDMKRQQSLETRGEPAPISYSGGASDAYGKMFRVMEKSIGGECETIYETSKPISADIKANILQELSLHQDPVVNVPQMRQFQPFYVFKTKNYQNCRTRPVWQHLEPPAVACRGDDCHLTASNSSATLRYLLDGDTSDFRIQSIIAESEALIYPYGHQTEQLWTVSNQTMYLTKYERMGSFIGKPRQPYAENNLFFKYPTADDKKLKFPDLKSEPQISHVLPGIPIKMIKQKMPVSQLVQRMKQLVEMVDQYLRQVPEPTTQHVAGVIIELERGLGLLSYAQIQRVYEQIRSSESQVKIFFDTLALVGTNPAVSFLMDAITNKMVTPIYAVTLIAMLPMTIKTPTPELMTAMVQFFKNLPARSTNEQMFIGMKKDQLRMTTALTLSNVFHQLCISNVTVHFSFAQSIYGEPFCNGKMKELVKSVMIPYLSSEIQRQTEPTKLAYIQALGNIGHRDIIPVLEGVVLSPHSSPLLASRAIYALHAVVKEYPERVRQTLAPVFDDQRYPIEVRLAAFTILLDTNPPIFYWQKIAVSTWHEPSEHIVAFVHSAFMTLAENTMAQIQPLFEMSRRARITLPLVRPPKSGMAYSSSYSYVSRLLSFYQMAAINQISQITSPRSIVPSVFYGKFQQYINSLVESTSKYVININGVQGLIDRVVRNTENPQSHARDTSTAAILMKRITEQLRITSQPQDRKFQAAVYIQLMGAIEQFFTLSNDQLEDVISNAQRRGVYTAREIQKIFYLEDKTVTFPSEMGMPVIYIKKMAVVASMRGQMSVSYNYNTGNYSITMKDVQPFMATKNRVMVTTVNPWTLRLLGAGVENNVQVSLPLTYQATMDTQHKQVHVSVTMPSQPRRITLAHLQTLPFTTAISVTNYAQMTTDPKTIEIWPRQPSTIKIPFGSSVGIKGYVQLVSANKIFDFSTLYNEFKRRGSYIDQSSFWSLVGSLRPRHYDIIIDVPSSQLKTFETTITYGEKLNSRSAPVHWPAIQSQSHYQQVEKTIVSVKQALRQVQQHINVPGYHSYGWTVTATLSQKTGQQLHYAAVLGVGADREWYKQDLVASGQTNSGMAKLTTHLRFPWLSESRQSLLESEVELPISAELGFGKSNYNEHTVIMQGVARRDSMALQYVRRSVEAQRCQLHEAIGHPNSADCRAVKDQAATANVVNMGFTLNNLPISFRNASYRLDSLAKYMYWQYMTNNPYHPNSSPHFLNISLRYDPEISSVSAYVQKPFERTNFEHIPLPFYTHYEPYVLTLRKSASNKVVDWLVGVDKTVCIADKRMIKTFDNLTLERPVSSECWTLLTKDASGVMQVAIMEKQIYSKPAVRIIAGKIDVEVSMDSSGHSFQIKSSGSQPTTLQRNHAIVLPNSQLPLVRIEQLNDHVKIRLPEQYMSLRLSREAVQIQAWQTVYRNRLIGVCGNMDSELRDEMRGPQGCIFSRREDFLKSYIVPLAQGGRCHPSLPSPSACVRGYVEQQQQSPSSHSSPYHPL